MSTKEKEQIVVTPEILDAVDNYYKEKLRKGDFEIKEMGRYTAIIVIDGRYTLQIWVGNQDYGLEVTYTYCEGIILTQEDRTTIWSKIETLHKDFCESEERKTYEILKEKFEQ